ncbi:hypothetical protein F3J02_13400 [Acinetobacter sp. Tr-809]|uniref:hypothetical protein n=1 Tax=Acinetobacter sp. Tr-809 TaxID=2608324 RepID=UPI0014221244|nr:hypothetical protein [Acinetobacter sp. Tr-809]NIE97461.1 hypothetical protein [Acinetobacter sp. Tr-809]
MNNYLQRAYKVFEYFEPTIEKLVDGRSDHELVFALCKNLIIEIAQCDDLNSETDMHFSYLFNVSKAKDAEHSQFIDAVYLLSSQEVKVLIQYFHYRDIVTGYWEEIPRGEVFLAMKNNEYYHPQEGCRLSFEQYHQVVFPYFVPTLNFIKIWESIL